MSRLIEALHSDRVLLMDGAMGTELQRLGMQDDECSALWNLTHSEAVGAVHGAYLDAGAEILVANTFLANPVMLKRFGHLDQMDLIWKAALATARVFSGPAPIVLADIGPFPIGTTREEWQHCRELIALYQSADGILLETWSASQPASCIFLRRFRDAEFPRLISFSFARSDGKHEIRAAAVNCATYANIWGAAALGANCGAEMDLDDLAQIVTAYRQESDLPLFIRPNAGTPTRTPNGWEYPRSPEYMADKLWPLLEAGVTMVGGCCGTTPAHIAAFRRVVDEWNARNRGS
jgi:5-methyltetrahydrofolate--homocysteine methyltransferase